MNWLWYPGNGDVGKFNVKFKHKTLDKNKTFDQCVADTCADIGKMRNVCVPFSGGIDSEFVVRKLHDSGVKFEVFIVYCWNDTEYDNAINVCRELNITPTVLTPTPRQLELIHIQYSKSPFLFNAPGALPLIYLCKYLAKVKNICTVITSEHFMGDGDDVITHDEYAYCNEWDFYVNRAFPQFNHVLFFLHTPEMLFSTLPKTLGITWKKHKAHLYNLSEREKVKHNFGFRLMISNYDRGIKFTKTEIYEALDR